MLGIAALAASLIGAGLQYKASTDAQSRQNKEIQEGLRRQREIQMKAEKTALDAAQNFESPKRHEQQERVGQEIEANLIAPVTASQAVRAAEQTTQGDVSSDYSRGKAEADLETVKQAEVLARLLGKTTSAGRLRLNEGIGLMDTGIAMNQLQRASQGEQAATNIAVQQAGQVDPGMSFLGSLLQTGGSAYLGSNGLGGGSVTSLNEGIANMTSDPIASLNAQKGWTGGGIGSWFGKS